MAKLARLHTAAGRTIILGKEIGKGGEGAIFAVGGDSNLAVKIYHEDKRVSRADKVAAMSSAAWHATCRNVAFPIDPLFDQNNKFVGFTMRRVGGHQPIHNLYSPTSRKTSFPTTNNFRFLLRTAVNISRSLANVHATGCVVGDINHSGILIAQDATATWIDCDSFQASVGGRLFHCTVGTPEFTPPELQGKPLDGTARTADHDAFGLAIVIFNLLFMGRHPFSGRFLGRGDMPLEKAIEEFRFAYSARKNETRMEPPPGVPLLTDIPAAIRDAFETAFGEAGAKAGRPKAAEWVALIETAEKEVIACQKNAAHHYFKSASACPWCRMEETFPGFVAFTAATAAASPNPATLAELIAAIRAIPDPGPALDLRGLMPAFQGQPSAASTSIRDHWMGHFVGGILLALLGIVLFQLPAPFPAAGFLSFGGGILLACREIDSKGPLKAAVAQADRAWQTVERQWRTLADNRSWLATRRQADDLIKRLHRLGGEEANRIAGLKTQQRMKQLTLFLEKYPIRQATIKGIGDGRKATLRSYGIETAADIERSRIQNISGFGPGMTGALLAWRASIEQKFVFDSTRPIDPADIAAIRSDIARQSADLATQLRQSLSSLQQSAASIQGVRASLRTSAVAVWNRLKQSELDAAAAGGKPPAINVRRGIFAAIAAIGFVMAQTVNSPSVNEAKQARSTTTQTTTTQSVPPVPWQIAPPATDPTRQPGQGAPAVPAQATAAATDVAAVQSLLQKYGFLTTQPTGTWDQATRDALRDFKVVNDLSTDDFLDSQTEQKLKSSAGIDADQSFVGSWSSEPDCTGKSPAFQPLVINSRGTTSTGSSCAFYKIDHDAAGWWIDAACSSSGGGAWNATIKISVRDKQVMTWASGTTTAAYYRCRSSNRPLSDQSAAPR